MDHQRNIVSHIFRSPQNIGSRLALVCVLTIEYHMSMPFMENYYMEHCAHYSIEEEKISPQYPGEEG